MQQSLDQKLLMVMGQRVDVGMNYPVKADVLHTAGRANLDEGSGNGDLIDENYPLLPLASVMDESPHDIRADETGHRIVIA